MCTDTSATIKYFERKNIMKSIRIIRKVSLILLVVISLFVLTNCSTPTDIPDTSAPDRDFLDKLVGNTEDTDEPYVEPDTEAIADVAEPDTTEKPEDTTKKAEETTKKAEDTTKKIEDTTKKPTETTKKPEETTQKPADTTKAPDTANYVWIPTNGGTKYHKSSGWSNMIDPLHVSLDEAIDRGFTACKRCYK